MRWERHAARNPAIKNAKEIVVGTLKEDKTTSYQPDNGHGPLSATGMTQATFPELSLLPSFGKWLLY